MDGYIDNSRVYYRDVDVMVYVDTARNPYGRMIMSHMASTNETELHAMAKAIGLQRKWFQDHSPRIYRHHYDLCQAKKQIAIQLGAIEISTKELIIIMRENNH